MRTLEGQLTVRDAKFCVLAARFNDRIVEDLVRGALDALKRHGVPDSAVVPLDQGSTTEQTIAAVAGWIRRHGAGTALLVSDGFHLARLRLEARRHGLNARTTPTPATPIAAGSRREWIYLSAEALKVPIIWARGWIRTDAPKPMR